MIPADLLDQLREKDPELWERYAETDLSREEERIDEPWRTAEANEAWLQYCLQEAIRARGWYLTQWTHSDPIFPEIECVIHCPIKKEVPSGYKGSLFNDYFGRGDTEAEALLRAYLATP